jgi:DNA-binding transcriptional MerR regulator
MDLIRNCLALGLVPLPRRRRGRSGGLAFNREPLDRLRFIARTLAHGFPVDAIGKLLGLDGSYRTCRDVYLVSQLTLAAMRASEVQSGEGPPTVRNSSS